MYGPGYIHAWSAAETGMDFGERVGKRKALEGPDGADVELVRCAISEQCCHLRGMQV